MKNLIGLKFGKLTVIERAKDYIRPCDKKGRPKYKCLCECGKTSYILGASLTSGKTKSCGCNRGKNLFKHGYYKERLYTIWKNMKQRCKNKKDKYYKNISIAKEWNDYLIFRSWAIQHGYKDNLTIDRIDNNGNYEPSNCRWVNMKIQNNNKRNNIYITYNAETKTIHQWEEITGINASTINQRLLLGWKVERALTEPAFIGKNQHFKDNK